MEEQIPEEDIRQSTFDKIYIKRKATIYRPQNICQMIKDFCGLILIL